MPLSLKQAQQALEIDVETQFLCRSKEIRSVDEQAVRKEVWKANDISLGLFARRMFPAGTHSGKSNVRINAET